ncbi:hypothetical protein TKK_0002104 [Trichogramma kaykai]
MYINETFETLSLNDFTVWARSMHVCHVALKERIQIIQKEKGLPVACKVCFHHLFLTKENSAKIGEVRDNYCSHDRFDKGNLTQALL